MAFGETFEALVAGVQGALWALGGVADVLRSDNLSARDPRAESQQWALDSRWRFASKPLLWSG